MNVQRHTSLDSGHSIELGEATWNPKSQSPKARSIRNRYLTATGGFSPRSSSEVPIDDIVDMIKFAAQHDELSASQCADAIKALAESIQRQHP